MPQTIDVTGLAPDDIRAVELVVTRLREKRPPADMLLPGGIAPPPGSWIDERGDIIDARGVPLTVGGVAPRDLPPDEWIKWFHTWAESHPKRDIEIDDSRESIYDRDCE